MANAPSIIIKFSLFNDTKYFGAFSLKLIYSLSNHQAACQDLRRSARKKKPAGNQTQKKLEAFWKPVSFWGAVTGVTCYTRTTEDYLVLHARDSPKLIAPRVCLLRLHKLTSRVIFVTLQINRRTLNDDVFVTVDHFR